MDITYLGHSSFLMEAGDGTRIVTDPYGSIGFTFPRVAADLVTVSHGHYDHCNVKAVGGKPSVIAEAGKALYGGVRIEGFQSFHDEVGGARRGRNVVFRFQADGLTVCHLGDIGEPYSGGLKEKLGEIDVLMIPVGGHYTIGAAEAKKYVEGLSPAAVIPMHFFVEGLQVDIAGAESFIGLLRGEREVVRAGSKLTFRREEMQQFTQKIIVMERKQA